jgi:hypothetical protein
MKMTFVTKSITYYTTTDDPEFPDYRTDENGEEWENYLGGYWNPGFDYVRKKGQYLISFRGKLWLEC